MGHKKPYVRTPIEFKKYPTVVKVVIDKGAGTKKRDGEIKSLLMRVLMTNDLNKANREILNEAKELLK